MTRVLVTGAAGYLGRQVATRLATSHDVVGVDIAPATASTDPPGFDLRHMDVRDPGLASLVAAEQFTHVVHLAAILEATIDPILAHDVDVNGTANVLDACISGGVEHLAVASSGAAYGYHADNPVPLTEDDPLRGNATFPYSDHKRQVEELLARARSTDPGLGQLVLRIGTVLGPTTDNLITALLTRRILPMVAGSSSPFVFIWDADLVDVFVVGVDQSRTGIFNVAGDGTVALRDVAATMGSTAVPIPRAVLRGVLATTRWFGIGRYGPEQVDFLAHRPVLANDRLKHDFGYSPTMTSAEALEAFAHAHAARTHTNG